MRSWTPTEAIFFRLIELSPFIGPLTDLNCTKNKSYNKNENLSNGVDIGNEVDIGNSVDNEIF